MYHSLLFSKLIPGGNPTIILHEPDLSAEKLALAAKECMGTMHLQAEQVGALYVDGTLPRLEMMGGEFCINATRAAGMLLAAARKFKALSCTALEGNTAPDMQGPPAWIGNLSVSGMSTPAGLLICHDEAVFQCILNAAGCRLAGTKESLWPLLLEEWAGSVAYSDNRREDNAHSPSSQKNSLETVEKSLLPACYCAARIDCSDSFACYEKQSGVSVVRMPGMVHVLIDMEQYPFPGVEESAWKEASAAWRKQCGIEDEPASGVVWYSKKNGHFQIWPAVAVRASSSEYLETACGSASLALAWREYEHDSRMCGGSGEMQPMRIFQPSGERLEVFFELALVDSLPNIAAAWVCGPVFLVAQGSAYFSSL